MKIGVALGSGGARGLAHIAYLEELDKLGVKPACLSGASIGSIVGALYAGGMSGTAIRELALGISLVDIPRLVDLSGPRDAGIIKGRKIEEWLDRVLPAKKFEDLEIPLRIVAADFWRGEQVVFDSGDLVPAIRASISIPGVFEPYEFEGRLLVDGGVVNPVPVDLLPDAEFVVGIDVSGERATESPPGANKANPNRIEVLLRTYDIMGKIITEERLRDRKNAIYLQPALKSFRVGDFLKARDILASVGQDAESFRRKLVAKGIA
jgi:NTE family protein